MKLRHLALALALTASVPCLTQGQLIHNWTNPGTGAFVDGNNWDLGSVPSFLDDGLIDNGGTATIGTGDSANLNLISLGSASGTSGNLEVTDGVVFAAELNIGEEGTGDAVFSGGEVAIGSGSFFVGGRNGNGVGTLTVNNPAVTFTSDDDVQLGRVGEGTLNLSAGRGEGVFTVVGKFGRGVWNQSGGLYVARQDMEIGDGGRPDQAGTPGPREGIVNLSGGVLQADDFAIGNRNGTGTVHVSGNGRLITTNNAAGDLWVGRGSDWSGSPGAGGPTELRVTGPDAMVLVNGDFLMNQNNVASSSTLVAELTGSTHTTVKVAGDADLTNGTLQVALNGYAPVSGDSWTILSAGANFDSEIATIDAEIDAEGYFPVTHVPPAFIGSLGGTQFGQTDFPALPTGLSWDLAYVGNDVVLSVTGNLSADFNGDGMLDCADIDALTAAVASGSTDVTFDLTGDSVVDIADRDAWLAEAGAANLPSGNPYLIGDANLDGSVDVSDFNIWNGSKFSSTAAWCSGDFNADGSVDVSDFNLWNGNKFNSADGTAAVPEPTSLLPLLFAVMAIVALRR